MTQHTHDGISAFKISCSTCKYVLHVQFRSDQLTDLLVLMIGFVLIEQLLYFAVQEVAEFFQHGDSIGEFLRMLAKSDKLLEQVAVVHHIEVSGDDQVAGHPVVLSDEGVHTEHIVFAVCTIAQVTHHHFAHEMAFLLDLVGRNIRVICEPLQRFVHLFKDLFDGIGVRALTDIDVLLPDGHVQFDGSDTGTVLSAVMLFLHQEI